MNKVPSKEINRKLLHCLAVVIPVGIFYGPSWLGLSQLSICLIISSLLLSSVIIETARLKNTFCRKWFQYLFSSMLRQEESQQITGATYVLAGGLLCSLLALISESACAAAFLGFTLFVLGDAAAALAGKAFGRVRVGRKTLEGALGCYLLCVVLGAFLFPQLPTFLAVWGGELSLSQIFLIAGVITLLEFFPIQIGRLTINDNLYVPALATLAAMLLR